MKELKVVKELFEELEKNRFFLDDVKVVKAYGKKGALNVYIDNVKTPVADKDVYFIDRMDKVAFMSKVKNEIIENMSELAKHCIFSKLTKQGETRRLAEILGADEAALKICENHISPGGATYEKVFFNAKRNGVELNEANTSLLLLDGFAENILNGKDVAAVAIDGVYIDRSRVYISSTETEPEFYDLNGKKLKDYKMDKNFYLEPFIKDVSVFDYDNRYFASDKSVWYCDVYYYETDKKLYDIPFKTENYNGDIDAIAAEIKKYLEKKFDCKVEIIDARGGKDAILEFHLKF